MSKSIKILQYRKYDYPGDGQAFQNAFFSALAPEVPILRIDHPLHLPRDGSEAVDGLFIS